MAENYSLGSKFGFNVTGQPAKQAKTGAQAEAMVNANSIFSPVDNFFAKYEDVLNGNIDHDINMYSRQSMIIGMNLRASDGNIHRFDMNI